MNTEETMNVQQAIARIEQPQNMALDAIGRKAAIDDLLNKVALVMEVMERVMKKDEHYGKIPGCGEKPTLLKAGAEKLGMTFRLRPQFHVTEKDIGRGHREYAVKCILSDGTEGVGTCSTMESKYRYRTGPKTSTGKPVPREYWDLRASDPVKAQTLLGGKGFGTMKDDNGQWVISEQGERVEHDNPADYYNTCLKIGKKRAHVDAIITATACSDIFTQDLDDIVGQADASSGTEPAPKTHEPTPPAPKPATAAPPPSQPQTAKPGVFPTVSVVSVVEHKGTGRETGKPYTLYKITFDDGFGKIEASTFDAKIAELANNLSNMQVPGRLVTSPGKKAGTMNITSLEAHQPSDNDGGDQVPMDFDEQGNAVTP